MNSSFSALISANIARFQNRMRTVQNTIRNTAQDVEIDVTANTSPFMRSVTRIRARIAQLEADGVRIDIEARIRNFQETIGRIAGNIRAFGELASNTFRGLTTSIIPALAPVLAATGAAVGNLGASIGALGGLVFGLAGAFGAAGAAAGAFYLIAKPAIGNLEKEYSELNATQRRSKAVLGELKKEYQAVANELDKPINNVIQNALFGAIRVFRELRPLIDASVKAVGNLVTAFNLNLTSKPITDLFKYLNTSAGPILETLGKGGISFINGLASAFVAFAPLTNFVAKGFANIGKNFAEFTAGLSESSKFNAFVDYTIKTLPLLKAIFRDLGAGIIYFFSAFGGSSQGFLQGLADLVERFKNFSATLSTNQGFQQFLNYVSQVAPTVLDTIGNLFDLLINIGIGLAPVGAVLLVLLNNFLAFTNSVLESNRVIGIIGASLLTFAGLLIAIVPNVIALQALFGGLGSAITLYLGKAFVFATGLFTNFGATIAPLSAKLLSFGNVFKTVFTALTGPIGIVIVAITAFIAILVKLYKENEEFRNIVDKAWAAIKETFFTVVQAISTFVTDTFTQLKSFWQENQETIRKTADTVWKAIEQTILIVVKAIVKFMEVAWPAISTIVKVAWEAIKTVVEIAINIVLGVVTTVMALLNGEWSNAWELIKTTVSNVWGNIETFLSNVDLVSIGKNIIAGLAEGITKGFDVVKGAVTSLANNIKSWFEKDMEIHSPSRVMAALAAFIPAGVAVGIRGNLTPVQQASQALAHATIPDFSQTVAVSKDAIDSIQKILVAGNTETQKKITAIEAEYDKKRAEAVKKSNTRIADVNAKESEKKKKNTAAQGRQIAKATQTQNATLTKLEAEKEKKIAAITKDYSKDRFEIIKKYADQQVALEKFGSKELASYYLYAAKKFAEGSDEKIKSQIEYNKAIKALTAEQFEDEKSFIDKRKKYNVISLTQELAAYNKYVQGYKQGSEEQIYYDEKIAETRTAIYDRLTTINEEYTKKIKTAQEEEIDGVKNINKAYQDTEDARTQSLANTSGLFDEVTRKSEIFGTTLISNLQSQVSALREWSANIRHLADRGVSDGLLAELQQLGPGAFEEIRVLANTTDEQLKEYQNLFEERTRLAREQAKYELTGLRADADKEISELQSKTSTQLEEYKNEWITQIKAIREGTVNQFNPMISTLYQIGTESIQGLTNGLKSEIPALQAQAKAISKVIEDTIRKSLQIHSPSRKLEKLGVFSGQGLAEGLASTKGMLQNAINGLTSTLTNDVSATSLGLDSALTGGVNSNVLSSYEVTSGNDQIGVLKQIASLISQLNLTVELDGDIISEKVDRNRGNAYAALSTIGGL